MVRFPAASKIVRSAKVAKSKLQRKSKVPWIQPLYLPLAFANAGHRVTVLFFFCTENASGYGCDKKRSAGGRGAVRILDAQAVPAARCTDLVS